MNDDACSDDSAIERAGKAEPGDPSGLPDGGWRLSNHPIQRFRQLVAIAHFSHYWRECRYAVCRKRKRCTGGPRGTCRRFGRPLCEVQREACRGPGTARGHTA